jgi:hypothetical protein
MSDLTTDLERLLGEHRRIGSPFPEYLRPGVDPAVAEDRIASRLSSPPAPHLIELFGWHDGVDDDLWRRDEAGTGVARLFGDAFFAPLDDAFRSYDERLEDQRILGVYAGPDYEPTWQPTWFPAFSMGGETYAVECALDSPTRGCVYDPAEARSLGPRFRSLLHLVQCVNRRFEAGGYRWDPERRLLDEQDEILKPLYARERAESQGF